MTIFATEFPVLKGITKAQFVAEIVAWLRGMKHSTLLEITEERQITEYDDEYTITGENNETLRLIDPKNENLKVYGARYQFEDAENRAWRTEVVLTHKETTSTLRVKGQCLALVPGANVQLPKKPYFITSTIQDGWGDVDGNFTTRNTPHTLSASDTAIALDILNGQTEAGLPIVYASISPNDQYAIDINRLAKKLAGLAHVVAEPNRKFSLDIKEASEGSNPYGGTIAVCVKGTGAIRRFFIGQRYTTPKDLFDALTNYVIHIVSSRSAERGWEWQDLQEAQSHALRRSAKPDELDIAHALYKDEIQSKEDTIQQLRDQIEALQSASTYGSIGEDILNTDIIEAIGKQIYPGEFSDRIQLALRKLLEPGTPSLDQRTLNVISLLLTKSERSGRVSAFKQHLKSASRSSLKDLHKFLRDIGYTIENSSSHPKAKPSPTLFGVEQITLPSSPSDGQSGADNLVRDCVKALMLKEL